MQPEWFHHYFQRNTKQLYQQKGDFQDEDEVIELLHTTWPRYRYFCLTGKDRFAWVAYRPKKNDKMRIIRGAHIPFVLRPLPGGKFMLVGECWIQGLMEGEALDLPGFEWGDVCVI